MDAQNNFNGNIESKTNGGHLLDSDVAVLSSPEGSIDDWKGPHGFVESFVEVWDYVGGARFRGFVAERRGKRAMFVFFDRDAFGNELKSGLMALLELCGTDEIGCARLNLCLDRRFKTSERTTLMRDLGWVGFEATTLDEWTDFEGLTSTEWILLGMET